jgi:hypothetical protein
LGKGLVGKECLICSSIGADVTKELGFLVVKILDGQVDVPFHRLKLGSKGTESRAERERDREHGQKENVGAKDVFEFHC